MNLVNILHCGIPLCVFTTRPPGEWSENNKWVRLNDPGVERDVTCDRCRRVMLLMREQRER